MPENVTITSTVANHVLWMFDRGGYQPGTFAQRLLNAFNIADDDNFARLGAGFPEYAAAVQLAQYGRDGIARLQQIAGSEAAA